MQKLFDVQNVWEKPSKSDIEFKDKWRDWCSLNDLKVRRWHFWGWKPLAPGVFDKFEPIKMNLEGNMCDQKESFDNLSIL